MINLYRIHFDHGRDNNSLDDVSVDAIMCAYIESWTCVLKRNMNRSFILFIAVIAKHLKTLFKTWKSFLQMVSFLFYI